MLPSDLLMFRVKGGVVSPRRMKPTPSNLALAESVIRSFEAHLGQRRRELDTALSALEEGRSDYRAVRGLARLCVQMSDFAATGPVEPPVARDRVFALAQGHPPSRRRTEAVLEQAARELAVSVPVSPLALQDALFADLQAEQTLLSFEAPTPLALTQRFDLAQAQGLLYRAYSLVITARRNEPARYKQLLRYLKLFGLMATVEGDATYGFTLTLDGPTSLFGQTTRYGLAFAKFLPALLHVTKWDLTATLKPRRDLAWTDPGDEEWSFGLDSESGYVSHYPEPKEHDSALESGFAERFLRLEAPWRLEREVDLVPVPGGVILPDYRLAHPDGRSVLVEIVGYWRPEYLRKKFELLRKSGREDVIVCVSERLNLEKAGVDLSDFQGRAVWFKGVLDPKLVLERAERHAVPGV